MNNNNLLEKLSEIEHEQWIHWTKYMMDNLSDNNVKRWKEQIKTSYSELSEEEKESDRAWARKTIKVFESQLRMFRKKLVDLIEFRNNERKDNNIFRKSVDDLNNDFIVNVEDLVEEFDCLFPKIKGRKK